MSAAAVAETHLFEVGAEEGGDRLDRFLSRAADARGLTLSRTRLKALIEAGEVTINGVEIRDPARKAPAGAKVEIVAPPPEDTLIVGEDIPLNVVFEDEYLIVIDKPAGLVVHPAPGHSTGTLVNALVHHCGDTLSGVGGVKRPGIVHRLDKDTSGLMVVGKTLPALTALSRAIAAREVQREYLAITHGEVRPAEFSIDAPIGRDPQSRVRMAIVGSGKPARTDIVAIARADGFSALRCKLHTGRTHQIRVHLASRGHPLVADAVYGGRPALGMVRQALHATRLGFVHPVTGEPLDFDAAPPADLASAWRNVVEGPD